MNRLRAAVIAALLLLGAVNTVPAVAAEPIPLKSGEVYSVRPGDHLTVRSRLENALVDNGDLVGSEAFAGEGTLRMHTPWLTAKVTVKCDARPGEYPVTSRQPMDGSDPFRGVRWTRVRVQEFSAAARQKCREDAKNHPAPADPPEEQWPADSEWPQSPWDVRSFRPGSRLTFTTDGTTKVTSSAFTPRSVTGDPFGKADDIKATVHIKCGAKPGLYPVYGDGPITKKKPLARLRVTDAGAFGAARCQAASVDHNGALFGAAAVAVLAAVAVTVAVFRRRARRTP